MNRKLIDEILKDIEAVSCSRCDGAGEHEYPDDFDLGVCEECDGLGYMPIDFDGASQDRAEID